MVTVLLVTGSGRSGTSSVAGTLARLGFRVPQPEVEADERNPRGYYEPLWIADFHKRWLNDIPVRTIDPRPDAGRIAMDTLDDARETRLREWLAAELADELTGGSAGDVVTIKETRAYWVYPMWERVVADVGADLASLTMLRHPAQVVRSRDTAYLQDLGDRLRRQRETANVAAWMNSVFVTERATRGNPRAFVPYHDLIGDWRAAITRACGQLGIDPGDLTPPHDVDDFLTIDLNRSADTWEGLAVAGWLRELGDATWDAALRLAVDPDDAAARTDLDDLAARYEEAYVTATALASDDTAAQLKRQRRTLEDRLATKNERIARLRTELAARPD